MPNELVRRAALHAPATTQRGILERLFAKLFEGLVYAQIWEDPEVDMAALDLGPDRRLVTIASGGCNVMSYLLADPMHVLAVDLNPAHLALLELKLTAARHLPDADAFQRLFVTGFDRGNLELYHRWLAPRLSAASRAWWEGRDRIGRRRLGMLTRNLYAHGLLGRTIQAGHFVCWLQGHDPRRLTGAGSLEEQRRLFEEVLAPVFASRIVRAMARMPAAYFGLGIPPAQFAAMQADAGGDILALVKARIERLACAFPIHDNWFAWQAFARRYPDAGGTLPPYLRCESLPVLRERASRVDLHNATVTDLLSGLDAETVDGYVLLDAQDWMTREQIAALWAQIGRTSRPGAKVVFRTAAEASPLPDLLPPGLLTPWRYAAARSAELHARDRSAIYGGFHLYERQA